jgi:hypothetical protein
MSVVLRPGAPGPWIRTDTAIAIIVTLVLGGVWASYLYVAAQLAAIRRSGQKEMPRLRSSADEGGEKHT